MSCKKIIIENPDAVEVIENKEVIEVEATKVKIKKNDDNQLVFGLLFFLLFFSLALFIYKKMN